MVETATHELLRVPMTYEEYLTRFRESILVEWVAGEAIIHPPPPELHALIVGLTTTLIRLFVDTHDLGTILAAPFELRLPTGSSREPDILYLSRKNSHRRTEFMVARTSRPCR